MYGRCKSLETVRRRDAMSLAETNTSATFFRCLIRLVELAGSSNRKTKN